MARRAITIYSIEECTAKVRRDIYAAEWESVGQKLVNTDHI